MSSLDPDPTRPGYRKNGIKYDGGEHTWNKKMYGLKPVDFSNLNHPNSEHRWVGRKVKGKKILIMLGVVTAASYGGGKYLFYALKKKADKDKTTFDKFLESANDIWQDKNELWKNRREVIDYINEDNPEVKDSLKNDISKKLKESRRIKDSISNKTSSLLELNDNKTLILYPDHVLDQDNLINPQWRLQLG